MKEMIFYLVFSTLIISSNGESKWMNIDSLYQFLPASVHVYKSSDSLDGKPNGCIMQLPI